MSGVAHCVPRMVVGDAKIKKRTALHSWYAHRYDSYSFLFFPWVSPAFARERERDVSSILLFLAAAAAPW